MVSSKYCRVKGEHRLLRTVVHLFVSPLCKQNPVRGTASLTLDAWSCVQDVPMAERCPALREPVLQRLFDIVLQQCTLPAQSGPQRSPTEGSDYAEECDDNDDDDLIGAFRVGTQQLLPCGDDATMRVARSPSSKVFVRMPMAVTWCLLALMQTQVHQGAWISWAP